MAAGSAPEEATVEARAVGREAVCVLGERVDMPNLLLAADLVSLTSAAEALPIVVLEAVSRDRPFLSTPVGGISDAVGDAGTIVDRLPDAIAAEFCAAAADAGGLRELGAQARDRRSSPS